MSGETSATRPRKRGHEGIVVRHARSCVLSAGARCNCTPTYQAWVWSKRDKRKIKKAFPTLAAAKDWRSDAQRAVRRGTLAAPSRLTLQEAAEKLIEGMKSGAVRKRDGERYKPSLIRTYEGDFGAYICPDLGGHRLGDLHRRDVQALADRLIADGLSPSRVRGIMNPLRTLYRRALEDDDVTVNPTSNLRLPAADGARDRVASPAEAAVLLDALPEADRALWATAFYGGLRRGELRALRWRHVDLDANFISVQAAWDDVDGEIEPKSRKGTRKVPMAETLRRHLLEHKARTGRRELDAFVFGAAADRPFTPTHVRNRALKAWDGANAMRKAQGLAPIEPIGLHEARHSYVSIMHAAGFTLEEIGDYVGHSSAYMTDRYRHLLDGHEERAAAKLDAFLAGGA